MANITSVNTMVGVAQPSLDINRPNSGLVEAVVSGVGAVVESFTPSRNLEGVVSKHIEKYNQGIAGLEDAGAMTNTAIANMNRASKSSMIQEMIKAGAGTKEIAQHVKLLDSVFESDDRYASVGKGQYSMTSSYGDVPKMVINNADEYRQRTAMDAYASLSPLAQVHIQNNPDTSAPIIEALGRKQFNNEVLKQEQATATMNSDIFKWTATQKKVVSDKQYNTFLSSQQGYILDIKKALIDDVRSGTMSATEASTILNDTIEEGSADSVLLGLAKDDKALVSQYNNDIVGYRTTPAEMEALGTDIDMMTQVAKQQKLAQDLSLNDFKLGLPPDMKAKLHMVESFGDSLMDIRLIDGMLGKVENGAAIKWSMSRDNVMRDVIAPNAQKILGIQEVTEETTTAGNTIYNALYLSMGSYIKGKPLDAEIGATNVFEVIKEIKGSNYWISLDSNAQKQFQNQFQAFLKTMQNENHEFRKEYIKMTGDSGGWFSNLFK